MAIVANKAGTDAMPAGQVKDVSYESVNRLVADLTGAPQYVGEIVVKADGTSYMGYGTSAGNWQQMYPKQ